MSKDNAIGVRLDDFSLERLDALSLSIGKTRSAVIRRLLLFVDRDFGASGERSAFLRWSKNVDRRPEI